jgi:tRNA-specific 2-thiouridylase
LNNYIKKVPGDIVDIVTNKVMGTHDGVMFYTYGQNRQLNLGGNTTKYFVCGKNVKNNILFIVDQEHKAKYLSSTKCVLEQFN